MWKATPASHEHPWGSCHWTYPTHPPPRSWGGWRVAVSLNWEPQPLCSLSWPGGGQERPQPFWPLCLVPREQLGPWNTLSLSVADGMMERWVFLTVRLMDRAPQASWMGLGLQGGHLLAVNPEEGLAVSTFACAQPPKLQSGSCSGPVPYRDTGCPALDPFSFCASVRGE